MLNVWDERERLEEQESARGPIDLTGSPSQTYDDQQAAGIRCRAPACAMVAVGFFRFVGGSDDAEVYLGSPTQAADIPICEMHLFLRISSRRLSEARSRSLSP